MCPRPSKNFLDLPIKLQLEFPLDLKVWASFLGYAHEEFGYRLWDSIEKTIVRSRNVVFLEDRRLCLSLKNVVDLGPVPPTTVNDDKGSDMMLALEAQKDYLTSTRLLSMFYMSTPANTP